MSKTKRIVMLILCILFFVYMRHADSNSVLTYALGAGLIMAILIDW